MDIMDTKKLEQKLFKDMDKLPVGCQYCIRGEKLVLFVTGICGENCFYCPVSDARKEKDVIYANEKKITSIEEAIKEAYLCGSKGVGVTGGNPLLRIERTCSYIKALKNEFGQEFHAHLYTTPTHLDKNKLKMLKKAGLDEIRLHPTKLFNEFKRADNASININNNYFDTNNMNFKNYMDDFINKLKLCGNYIKDVGVEIPAIPNYEKEIIYLANELNKINVKFLNINELEYSETNYANLRRKGLYEKNDFSSEISGSEETAYNVIKHFYKTSNNNVGKIIIHYCPSTLKDGIQMKNRLINRANNIAKTYEVITEEGLLLRGIISFENMDDIKDVLEILNYNEIPYEIVSNNLYLNCDILEELIEELKNINYDIKFSAYISERYPTSDGLEVERTPLIVKKRSLNDIIKKKKKRN